MSQISILQTLKFEMNEMMNVGRDIPRMRLNKAQLLLGSGDFSTPARSTRPTPGRGGGGGGAK